MKVPEYVRKRRKLSPPDDSSSEDHRNGYTTDSLPDDDYLKRASRWNLEQKYENVPRRLSKREKQSLRLPIKTTEGRIEQIEAPLESGEDGSDSWLGLDKEEEEDDDEAVSTPMKPRKSSQEEIAEAQAELPQLAFSISEDPEENVDAFKSLAQLSQSPNYVVKQLALATQMTVFKDVIPGYRIRLLSDKDMAEKVSKEIRKQRAFEQTLLQSYKNYVETLAKCARKAGKHSSAEGAAIANIATSCACKLVLVAPHFNFRGDLIKILVHKLARREAEAQFTECRQTIEALFQDDDDGNASLDAVTQITRMIKTRDYKVDESVLNTFLCLRLLNEFSSKASKDSVDKHDEAGAKGKKQNQKREFRTKRHRKALKEIKAVEKDFREADAITHEERDKKVQAEMLKLVFGTYFRILKAKSSLTGAVLEGLAKFSHLVNQDFFGDLLEVLRELSLKAVASLDPAFSSDILTNHVYPEEGVLSSFPLDPTRTALLCTTTAFSLLSGQDASRLSLDLSSFASLLYNFLLPTLPLHPDLELSHRTLRLDHSHTISTSESTSSSMTSFHAPKINVSTLSTLLLKALSAVLTPRSSPPTRLASFTHRLMIASLHTPEKTSRAMLALLAEVARVQGRKVEALWRSEERRGDGEFDPLGSIDGCKPFCGNVWEGEILRFHFSEGVRKGCGELEGIMKDLA